MGTCNIKSIHDFKSKTIPDVYYLDRLNSRVINITTVSLKSIYFDNLSEIYQNSAIIYLSDSEFMIAGGTKTSGNFSKKVFRLNTSLKTSYRLQNLPIRCSEGSLVLHKSSILLGGAVCQSEDLLIPCPLLKFSISGESWDILDVNDLLTPPKHSYSNILSPKVCIKDSKLLLLGGKKLNKNDFTKKIFSIDLTESLPRYRVEDISLPNKFKKLNCCFISNSLVICGEIKSSKQRCIVAQYSHDTSEWSTLETIDGILSEEYPVLVISKKPVFFSYPYFLFQDRHKVTIVNFESTPSQKRISKEDSKEPVKTPSKLRSPLDTTKSRSRKKKFKTQISAQYSRSTAPKLPSNVVKNQSISSSLSSSSSDLSSSSISETSELTSESED